MKKFVFGVLLVSVLASGCESDDKPSAENSNRDLISEEYLRTRFTFRDIDKMKFAECETLSYPTCRYVWGKDNPASDAALAKYGRPPSGNKLMIIYARGNKLADFNRVLATYKDAVEVDNLGVQAVWSDKRKQLSLITDSHLIIHVQTDTQGVVGFKENAIVIANHVLDNI
ncbi:MAG: hypothetical protein ABFS08_03365 [Pseudomonadota bacterium]